VIHTLYLVRRRGLHLLSDVSVSLPLVFEETLNRADDTPRTVPVAAFATVEEAECRARDLEREGRRLRNPFWAGHWGMWRNSRSEDDFLSSLTALGIVDLPKAARRSNHLTRNWYVWWEQNADEWPDEVFQAVWDLLDLDRLYDVVPVEIDL
jgi:hypothetical protein